MINNLYFKLKNIRKRQSFGYQVMLILMNEHYRSRMYKEKNIGNLQSNSLYFDSYQWKDMVKKITKTMSKNHKRILNKNKEYSDKTAYIISTLDYVEIIPDLLLDEQDLKNCKYALSINEGEYEFKMTQAGYRYQFNGYMSSEDKSNRTNTKIQWIIAIFTFITTLYYLLSWFKPELNIEDVKPFFNSTYSFFISIFSFFNNFKQVSFLDLILIISIVILYKKIDKNQD